MADDDKARTFANVRIEGVARRIYRLPDGSWWTKPMADLAALFGALAPEFRKVSARDFTAMVERPESASEVWARLRPEGEPVKIERVEFERPEFQIGDVVELKSGGAQMTVVSGDCCGPVLLVYSKFGEIVETELPRECLVPSRRREHPDDIPF